MTTPQIRLVDPHDPDDLAAAYAVLETAQREGRPDALLDTMAAIGQSLRDPSSTYRSELLVAELDGEGVGVALIGRHLVDNAHLADLEVSVLPDRRRRGIGRALLEASVAGLAQTGHTTVLGEVNVPGQESTSPGLDFAVAHGWATVHLEDHLVLDLPAQPARPAMDESYEVISWVDRCPEEHLVAYCEMRTRMALDVPTGEIDHVPAAHTPERQREQERRMTPSYVGVVTAARRRGDGTFAGYSELFLPHHEPHIWQGDTLVMPDERGHGLGLALKHASLDVVRRDHPERTSIHTWVDPANAPMCATNRAFGFRAVERMHEVQRATQRL